MSVRLLRSFITALLPLVFFIGVQVARGDIFGRIAGTAKDATGAVIPGITVTAACVETGIKQTTKTDAQGFYAFPRSPWGITTWRHLRPDSRISESPVSPWM
jgi:hypothetical protein